MLGDPSWPCPWHSPRCTGAHHHGSGLSELPSWGQGQARSPRCIPEMLKGFGVPHVSGGGWPCPHCGGYKGPMGSVERKGPGAKPPAHPDLTAQGPWAILAS